MAGVAKKGYISCQGESGSCAFGASRVHYFNYTAAPQPSFEEVVRRVVERDAEIGILPIQNSRSGLIGEPLSILTRADVKILAEHHQPIRHHLMVNASWVDHIATPEVRHKLEDYAILERSGKALDAGARADRDQIVRSLLSQITAIYSDEQGLRQCDRGLKINLAGAERRLTSCTAKASRVIAHETDMAKLNKQELPAYAAIASEECATMYKNIRLVSDLNDDKVNTTRYVVVSREEAKAAQIVADIDVKGILAALSPEDLQRLFEVEPLRTQFEEVSVDFAFGPSSFKAGQDATARARLLRDFLAGDRDALQSLLDHLDFPSQRRIKLKLEPLVAQIREHVTKGQGKSGEAMLKALLRTKKYSDKVRSIFVLRSKSADVKQADLLTMLVEKAGRPRKERIAFSVIAELPKPVDGKDEGLALVIEADGSLLGADKTLSKKKSSGSFEWGFSGPSSSSEPSELERVLRDFVDTDKAVIRVLGTFAKELNPLGSAPVFAEKPAKAEPAKTRGWGGKRDRVPQADGTLGATGAGAFAAFFAALIAAGAIAYYTHLFGF